MPSNTDDGIMVVARAMVSQWADPDAPDDTWSGLPPRKKWEGWVSQARAAITAYESHLRDKGMVVVPGWQPIETAPTDGTEIIGLGFPPGPLNGHREDTRIIRAWRIADRHGWSALNGHTWFTVGFEPTHWMPLPASPSHPATKSE